MLNNIKSSVDAHQSTEVDYVLMLKMCMQLLGLARNSESESKRNKLLLEGDGKHATASFSLDYSTQSKNFLVRIVHAGGQEELFPNAVPASLLMDKYPGKCVARPEVFKKPQESLLRPEENLLPGQKYYIIPCTTAQKLKRKQQNKVKKAKDSAEDEEMILGGTIVTDSEGEDTDDSACSASDFVSKEKRSKSSRRRGIRGNKKPFVPPLPKARSSRGFGWEPSLTSVQEVSP